MLPLFLEMHEGKTQKGCPLLWRSILYIVIQLFEGCVCINYCTWSVTAVMASPMQPFGICMCSMAQTVGAMSVMCTGMLV